MLLQREKLHFINDMIDGMLNRRWVAHRTGGFRLKHMKHARSGQIAKTAVVQDEPVKRGRADRIEADPVDRVGAPHRIANPVRLHEL